MSNDTNSKNRPTHTAYSVRRYKQNGDYRSDWTSIGAAWLHKDGDGFDIILECTPMSGRVTLRKNKPKAEQDQAPEQPPEQA